MAFAEKTQETAAETLLTRCMSNDRNISIRALEEYIKTGHGTPGIVGTFASDSQLKNRLPEALKNVALQNPQKAAKFCITFEDQLREVPAKAVMLLETTDQKEQFVKALFKEQSPNAKDLAFKLFEQTKEVAILRAMSVLGIPTTSAFVDKVEQELRIELTDDAYKDATRAVALTKYIMWTRKEQNVQIDSRTKDTLEDYMLHVTATHQTPPQFNIMLTFASTIMVTDTIMQQNKQVSLPTVGKVSQNDKERFGKLVMYLEEELSRYASEKMGTSKAEFRKKIESMRPILYSEEEFQKRAKREGVPPQAGGFLDPKTNTVVLNVTTRPVEAYISLLSHEYSHGLTKGLVDNRAPAILIESTAEILATEFTATACKVPVESLTRLKLYFNPTSGYGHILGSSQFLRFAVPFSQYALSKGDSITREDIQKFINERRHTITLAQLDAFTSRLYKRENLVPELDALFKKE